MEELGVIGPREDIPSGRDSVDKIVDTKIWEILSFLITTW